MKILKNILSESKEYYVHAEKDLQKRLASLPIGSIKERVISGKKYYYYQERNGVKVEQKYLGKDNPEDLVKKIAQRKILKDELKQVKEALKILIRSEGKRGRASSKHS